ncbi:MAG: trigger factor [Planctomycetes bacterium GWF2_41_51]|nr:MAG: trigger factor [Planctomycetes bacterium GWF2_41_51]HBG27261.1 trigger factor [Phycisphaerales bacterium]
MAKEKQPAQTEEVKEEIKNTVEISDAGPCKKKIAIEIPAEKITKALDDQYEQLRKDAIVAGFRKGRAPRRLLEKRYGKESAEQVKLKLIMDASEAAIKDNEINSLGEPNIEHEKIEMPEKGPMKFEFEIEVRPEFELPSLEGIEVEKPKLEITDETIDKEIAELQKRLGTFKPKEGKIALEDQVIADVALRPDGGELEKITNTEITVHQRGFVGKVFVDDLDKVLVGAKAGDVKTAVSEVPATFFDEKYRGKKVEVEIKVNDVKQLEPVALNEEFFKRIGVANIDELKKTLRERNEKNVERQQRDVMRQEVRDFLNDKVDFDLPMDVVADQSKNILQRQYTRMLLQGAKAEDVQKQMEELKAASDQQAQDQLKAFFVMDAVAKKLGIEATEEEINGYIAQAAMYRQMRPEKLREQMARDGSLSEAALEIREMKCIDKILETAKVSEVEPKKIEEKQKKAAEKAAAKAKPAKKAEKTEKAEEKAEKKTAKSEKKADKEEEKEEKPAKKSSSKKKEK